jgi:hypothetical protein
MICGTADHRSGKHRSESTPAATTPISTNKPSTAAAHKCLRPLLPQEWHGHLHQEPNQKSGFTGNITGVIHSNTNATDRSTTREATPSEDRYRTNMPANYKANPCDRTYRGSTKECMSPHEETQQQIRATGLTGKKSTNYRSARAPQECQCTTKPPTAAANKSTKAHTNSTRRPIDSHQVE